MLRVVGLRDRLGSALALALTLTITITITITITLTLAGCDSGTCRTSSECADSDRCMLGRCVPKDDSNPPGQTPPAPAIWEGRETGFLWRIEGAAPTYLLGTIHVGVDPRGFPDAVFGAFDASPLLAIETDITTPIAQATLDRYALLPADLALHQLLPPDVYTAVSAELADTFNAAQVARLEPWYVSILLGQTANARLPTMEPALLDRAGRSGKTTGFLEPVEDQLSALSRIRREVWIEDIIAVIRDPGGASMAFDGLVDAYLRGDGPAIQQLLGESDEDTDLILLRDRNLAWIPQIEMYHQQGGAFVAVGLAHLIGDHNVIGLLQARGSTVAAVHIEGSALRSHELERDLRVTAAREEELQPMFAWPWF